MQSPEISIVIPVRNVENEITGILRSLVGQTSGLETELIVVDMGSGDQTVLESLQFIKEQKLNGCVIQNGSGSVSTALNTGLQKSNGSYVTFIFARRLYRDFIRGYVETMRGSSADLVSGCALEGDLKFAELNGADCVKALIKGELQMDVSAIMLRRKFLLDRQIYFQENCSHGYTEEFVMQCLLLAGKIVQSPTLMKRDKVFELKRGKTGLVGTDIFQSVDAMLRVRALLDATGKNDKELLELFTYRKIPAAVMHCVDVMLREGNGYNAIRGYLRVHGYEKLLVTNRRTGRELKYRIQGWQLIPWMYRPKQP